MKHRHDSGQKFGTFNPSRIQASTTNLDFFFSTNVKCLYGVSAEARYNRCFVVESTAKSFRRVGVRGCNCSNCESDDGMAFCEAKPGSEGVPISRRG